MITTTELHHVADQEGLRAWINRLGPMLKDVPEFDLVWDEWVNAFHDLIKDAK